MLMLEQNDGPSKHVQSGVEEMFEGVQQGDDVLGDLSLSFGTGNSNEFANLILDGDGDNQMGLLDDLFDSATPQPWEMPNQQSPLEQQKVSNQQNQFEDQFQKVFQ
eukprot:scaffold147576_cov46-Prasinocladus_malaysianus.AAC.1